MRSDPLSESLSAVLDGDVFVQASPPPGYTAMRATVQRRDENRPGWAWVVYSHSPTERPCQIASLANPKLWLKGTR